MREEPLSIHVPVLADEIVQLAELQPGQTWVDGTAGGGGHTQLFAGAVGPHGRVLAIDRDPTAIERLDRRAMQNVYARCASYVDLPGLCQELGWEMVDGILLDLGLSSDQLADRQRGFSFQHDGPLDMRFDPTLGEPAWQWLQRVDERTLADTIFQYGEERHSRRIARNIVQQRRRNPIRTVAELRQIIYASVPAGRRSGSGGRRHGRVDPATRTFQALRIAVNDELGEVQRAMQVLPSCLGPAGKLLVISFHSLEDRIVKHAFRNDPRLQVITKKPVRPSDAEIARNPRSRSAKLRVATRVDGPAPTGAPGQSAPTGIQSANPSRISW
ncbi:MAG: 16S rRNA (cytosine(1402)-N(4))-methyltransferase RsmH [Planctomycetota bacterium]|nr:MAG: 16S rRNA (cytosine(1402)-N(4))-methyltransferase RsmH [Planctomycetota bacterium]